MNDQPFEKGVDSRVGTSRLDVPTTASVAFHVAGSVLAGRSRRPARRDLRGALSDEVGARQGTLHPNTPLLQMACSLRRRRCRPLASRTATAEWHVKHTRKTNKRTEMRRIVE